MRIKTKKHFNRVIKTLALEIFKNKELDEITATDDVAGYDTPLAFTGKKGKKKKKKVATNSTGYNVVSEELDNKDIKVVRKLIRDVVANILRDIWLKRSVWKQPK